MGYKDICLTCRKAFSRGTDFTIPSSSKCPECGGPSITVSHLFQPPKKTELKKWKVVEYLIENGFRYDHAFKKEDSQYYGRFPETMKEAIEFVKYQKEK
ncbi:hypothetical protein Aconfl_35360 [Algoriphagus confluentis]|uniref:Zinc ribbon domain-containing protein n=1 Tax=Algoriphagus confluentis TaxID=1697556 RepID=A0ABQ6PUK5_9BACT|nr:hypothetical protein Aconfl_35360 [Algoriphagus confluentis]